MRNVLFLASSALAVSCVGFGGPGGGAGDDTSGSSGDDSSVVDDTGENNQMHGATCTISGTVIVQLYTYDDDGELEYVSFEDAYGGAFPFGAVWVTSYRPNGDGGVATYTGAETFHNPSTTGDAFQITARLEEEGEIRLFAMLDYWNDRVLGSSEASGIYPDAVDCTDGSTHTDVDITILAPYSDSIGDGSGGDGGASGCNAVGIDGDILITSSYAGGEAAAMLLDANSGGPHHWQLTEPTTSGGGAQAAYALEVCENFGTANLVGCWDSDGNLLFDPGDTWGAYIVAPDESGNPISVGTTDLNGYDIQIPLGEGESPWGIVPFVTLSGELNVDGGVFDDLPAGTSAYVTALKYRPVDDIDVSTLALEAYDMESFAWGDLAGETTKSWSINVPANTIVYMWAYADTNGNGVVNEVGELVSSGGINTSGKLPTGSSSTSGIVLGLAHP